MHSLRTCSAQCKHVYCTLYTVQCMNVYKILRRIRTTLEPVFTINKQNLGDNIGIWEDRKKRQDKKRRISVKLKKMR